MRTIIIPDIHNRVGWIESTLEKLKEDLDYTYDKVVFLGDIFDSFFDTSGDIEKAAEWLKQSVKKTDRIHLYGTHDLWYRFPYNPYLMVSGNSPEKEKIINSILDKKDWNKLTLMHYEQGYLSSHAGVHQELIDEYKHRHRIDEVFDIVDNVIKPALEEAYSYAEDAYSHPWLSAGRVRLGTQRVGGIIWLDWIYEFKPVPGINQIVGHTQINIPDKKVGKNSVNYNLDTKSRYIGILENGQLTWKNVNELWLKWMRVM